VLLSLDAFSDDVSTVSERLPRRDCVVSPIARRGMTRAQFSSTHLVLPGGIRIHAPSSGHVLTIPMDGGYDVHVERTRAGAMVTVEAASDVPAPVDDDELAALVQAARDARCDPDSDDAPARTLRDAWAYRCAFARLTEQFPTDIPIGPIRWITLSFRNHVRVPGFGALEIDGAKDRRMIGDTCIVSRRVGKKDRTMPPGAVEIVVIR
jgi:hypothetical protein